MVRLEVFAPSLFRFHLYHFNSTMVRLEAVKFSIKQL